MQIIWNEIENECICGLSLRAYATHISNRTKPEKRRKNRSKLKPLNQRHAFGHSFWFFRFSTEIYLIFFFSFSKINSQKKADESSTSVHLGSLVLFLFFGFSRAHIWFLFFFFFWAHFRIFFTWLDYFFFFGFVVVVSFSFVRLVDF